jgi:hypothetical protein
VLGDCFGIARILGKYGVPEALFLGAVATFRGPRGEIAQGEVSADALVNAAKLLATLQDQDPPPDRLGLTGERIRGVNE